MSYAFIFHTFKRTRCLPTHYTHTSIKHHTQTPKQSTFEIFRNSRFYVSGLLILNFLVFVVVTDVIYLFCVVIGGSTSHVLIYSIWILNNVSYLCDAVIYVFLQPLVRKMLWRKVAKVMPGVRRAPSTQKLDVDMRKRKASFYMIVDK